MSERSIPRMRTIDETAKLTGVSAYQIRRMVKQNSIVHIRVGGKYLINLDKFIDYLNGAETGCTCIKRTEEKEVTHGKEQYS